ncbi:MAG: UDP-N-acetylglucosamine diphosphorylase [Opitutaceae bacterium]|nr:UDP-N-acetylglucosamine diphosphorylase [Opitutaceae bacterium]
MQADSFFTLPSSLTRFAPFFPATAAPWVWIPAIREALAALASLPPPPPRSLPPGVHVEGAVYLDPTVILPPTATLIGPAWIGARTEIRPGAYVRGGVIVGEDCVLGNACEFKNCLLLDGVQVPHFSYVGDSVLGNRSHLGAGVILSNLRLDRKPIVVHADGLVQETGLRKFGAILGDEAEVGCNAVLNPGSILGKRALVMPTVAFSGVLPANTLAKVRSSVSHLPRRD